MPVDGYTYAYKISIEADEFLASIHEILLLSARSDFEMFVFNFFYFNESALPLS